MNRLNRDRRKVQTKSRHELKRKKRRNIEKKKKYAEKYRGKIPLDTADKMILKAKLYKYI